MVTTTVDENGVEYLVPDYPDLDEAYPKDLLRMSYLRHNRIPDLYASGIILSVVAIVAVVLRGMARRKTKQKFGWDDYAIMVGLLFFLALTLSIIVYISTAGLGAHELLITAAQQMEFFEKTLLEIQLLYLCTMTSIKLSILFLYLRLFGVSQWFRIAAYGAIVMIALWFIACLTVAILSSEPLHSIIVPQWSAVGSGVSNVATDLVVLCLPLRMVWLLKANRQTKVKLVVLFSLGLFVCIASLIRIIYLWTYVGWDQTYETARIVYWTVVECGLSIITASLPIVRLLFKPAAPSTSATEPSSYLWARKKSRAPHSSTTRSWDRNNRRGWSVAKSNDESQVDIVRGDVDVSPGKNSQSKDEEMNWAAIEMTERENTKGS